MRAGLGRARATVGRSPEFAIDEVRKVARKATSISGVPWVSPKKGEEDGRRISHSRVGAHRSQSHCCSVSRGKQSKNGLPSPKLVAAGVGENLFARCPPCSTASYCSCPLSYFILEGAIVAKQGRDSLLAGALGRDRKAKLSVVIYGIAIGLSFLNQWVAGVLYALVAAMWFIPDRRIERALERRAV